MSDGARADAYRELLRLVPRRTNECWLGDIDDEHGVYVIGHRFMLRVEGTTLAMWRLIDGRHSVQDIADCLNDAYTTPDPDVILESTVEFLLRLETLGLAAWRTRPLFEQVELDGQH